MQQKDEHLTIKLTEFYMKNHDDCQVFYSCSAGHMSEISSQLNCRYLQPRKIEGKEQRKMKRLSGLFVLVVLLFSACEQGEKQETRQLEQGVSKSLNDSRKQNIGKIIYTLILNVPTDNSTHIKAGEQIDFELVNNDAPLVIDYNAPAENILKVDVNGAEGKYTFENGHIILSQSDLKEGKNQVKIDFVIDDNKLIRTDDFLYAGSLANGTSALFPCFDQPNLKSLFTLNLIVKPGWTALSNAPILKVNEGPERVLYQFANTKPISPAHFAFAAGDFEYLSKDKNGRKANIFVLNSDVDRLKENEDYLFDLQLNAMEWMEAYTQIAYPFNKLDLLLLPDLQKDIHSQPGLVCIQSEQLLIDGKAIPEEDLNRARLIASGTAQMWFGSLLGFADYSDAWMMETITAYLASKMVEPSFTMIMHELEFFINHYPKALAVDRTSANHPVVQSCENSANADLLNGAIASHKAPIVFRQLEKIVGEEKMRAGLMQYLKNYPFSNAGWDDLIAILDTKTHDDLKAWSDIWFKETGMPEYKAFQEFDLYVVNQYDQNRNDVIWPQSLDLFKKWTDNWQHKEVWDDTSRYEFPIPDMVDIVILNWHSYAYGYFFQNLREKVFLLSKRMYELDPLRRGVSYVTLWENLVRGNLLPLELREAMEIYFARENQPPNINLLASYYEELFWRYSKPELRGQMAETMDQLLWDKLINGVDLQQKQAYYLAFTQTATTTDGIDKMLSLWKDNGRQVGLKLTERESVTLAYELAVRRSLPTGQNVPEDVLTQQKKMTENPILIAEIDFVAPALSMDIGIRDNFFASLQNPENLTNEAAVVTALEYLNHPLRAEHAEKYVLPSLEMLDEVRNSGISVDYWLNATFSGHRTNSVTDTVDYFLSTHKDINPKLGQKVLQAVDPVRRAIQLELDFETKE